MEKIKLILNIAMSISLVTLLISGCTSNKKEPLEIQKRLKNQEETYSIIWSDDKSFTAFVKGDPESLYGQIYIWFVGEKEATIISEAEGRISELILSPDNKYILADIGTSVQRHGEVISVKKREIIDKIGYVGRAIWTPDSKWLIYGAISDIQPKIDTELSGTVDLAMYNIETKDKKIIKKGNSDYFFLPMNINNDNSISFFQRYFENMDLDQEFKLIYLQDGNIEIK